MITRKQSLKVESAANLVLLKTSLKGLRRRTTLGLGMMMMRMLMSW